jgi:hypothetical protein
MPQLGGGPLTIDVHLMAEPCLWQWEIRDAARDEVVASSWTHEWMAYETPDDAFAAGHVRLTSLTDR